MSLCPHGYTANWDCPRCLCCCGSGLPAGECRCIAADAEVGIQRDAPPRDYCEACGYTDSHDPNCPRPKGT